MLRRSEVGEHGMKGYISKDTERWFQTARSCKYLFSCELSQELGREARNSVAYVLTIAIHNIVIILGTSVLSSPASP
jgi:hypothetical protein